MHHGHEEVFTVLQAAVVQWLRGQQASPC